MLLRAVPILLVLAAGCGKGKGEDQSKDKSPPNPNSKPAAAEPSDAAPAPTAKVHAGGMERFKDPGVYIDGKPTGVLRFGELPHTLKPVWIEERAALPFKKGDTGPRHRIVKSRRYRFSEYFQSLGVDLDKVKELHMYGGNQKAAAVIIPGKSLREFDDFYFRFGGAIWGKPLPACPAGVGDGKCPDQIGTLALYLEKEPPKREGGHFYFEGKRIDGIPYFGEPIRGGIRVYHDGKLAATIKRKKLMASGIKAVGAEGKETYSLMEFLATQGVDTKAVKEMWTIEYERRTRKYSREELLDLRFQATQEVSGEVSLGSDGTLAQVIHLHSEELSPEDLPQLLPEEIEKADG